MKNIPPNSLVNLDFELKRVNNVDPYLIRQVGKLQLRFIWRSLSRQFLIELRPQ